MEACESTIGCSIRELEMAIKRAEAFGTVSTAKAIEIFLQELAKIKNEEVYYLLAKFSSGSWCYDEVYVPIEPEEFADYQKIVSNYDKTNIGFVRVGDSTISGVHITPRPRRLGPPTDRDGRVKYIRARSEHIRQLKQIPATPFHVFSKISDFIIDSNCVEFRASENTVKALFNFEISMDEKNHVEYMGYRIELEAGRGDKWYFRVDPHVEDEIKDIFVENTSVDDDSV